MAQTKNLSHRQLDLEKEGIDIIINQQIGETADDVISIRISLDQALQVGKFLIEAGTTKRKSPSAADTTGFEDFWMSYPRKENKQASRVIWASKKCGLDLPKVLTHLGVCKDSEQWVKEGGRFVPMPTTYLRQQRYLDSVETSTTEQYR